MAAEFTAVRYAWGIPAQPSCVQIVRPRNLGNVMAVAITGGFEAYLSIGVGMHTQTWVKTFTLTALTRVVIDVGR